MLRSITLTVELVLFVTYKYVLSIEIAAARGRRPHRDRAELLIIVVVVHIHPIGVRVHQIKLAATLVENDVGRCASERKDGAESGAGGLSRNTDGPARMSARVATSWAQLCPGRES